MIEPKPVPRKNKHAWIWIVAAVVVLCLCCLVVSLAAGAFAAWKGYIHPPQINPPNGPLPLHIPGATLPAAPTQAPSQILVEPYQPQATDQYPTLQNLVPNWAASTAPGTQSWDISVPASQSTLLFLGWCTSTPAILNDNFSHLQYLIEVDGQALSLNDLHSMDGLSNGMVCRDFAGLIRAWPAGEHIIKTSMRLDKQINDGMSDFPAGDYVDIYNITVTP
jgi:hypothetical protein